MPDTFQVICYKRDGARWNEDHISFEHGSPFFAVKVMKGLNNVARRDGLANDKQYGIPTICQICLCPVCLCE